MSEEKKLGQQPTGTYSQNPQKTGTYSSESNSTGTYNQGSSSTGLYGSDDHTSIKSEAHQKGPGDILILKNKSYTIIEILSQGTAEAVIYKVKDNYGKFFVVKLYYEYPPQRRKEEPSHETLSRIKEISDPDILKLYDFGVDFNEKYQGKYCFEVSDFAQGGDLFQVSNFKLKYTADFIEKVIVKQLFLGIKALHRNKIYHCDIKPSNIFYLDKEQQDIVIGDYGSAKAYDLNLTKEVNKTSVVKGTQIYIAIEQPHGIVSEKNDYFSFGMVILHLLYAEQLSENGNFSTVNKDIADKIALNCIQHKPLINYNPIFSHLNQLIAGLTLSDRDQRWGQDEVEKWIEGKQVEVVYKQQSTSVSSGYSIYVSGGRKLSNLSEVVNFIKSEDNWYQELLADNTTRTQFLTLLDQEFGRDERQKIQRLIKYVEEIESKDKINSGNPFLKSALLSVLSKNFSFDLFGKVFQLGSSQQLETDIKEIAQQLDNRWKDLEVDSEVLLTLHNLEMSLRVMSSDSSQTIKQTIAKTHLEQLLLAANPQLSYDFQLDTLHPFLVKCFIESVDFVKYKMLLGIFSHYEKDRPFKGLRNEICKSIEEIGLYFAKDTAVYSNEKMVIEFQSFVDRKGLHKYKNSLPIQEFLLEVFAEQAETNIDLVDLDFDKNGNYNVKYKYYKILTPFLLQNGIQNEIVEASNQELIYSSIRGRFQSFEQSATEFVNETCKAHDIKTLSQSNKNSIIQKAVKLSKKTMWEVFGGQIIAAVLFIPLVILFYFQIENLDLKVPFNQRWDNSTEAIETAYEVKYVKAAAANIRSIPSTKGRVIFSINYGDEVKVLQRGFMNGGKEWYKIDYNGTVGYMSETVLKN